MGGKRLGPTRKRTGSCHGGVVRGSGDRGGHRRSRPGRLPHRPRCLPPAPTHPYINDLHVFLVSYTIFFSESPLPNDSQSLENLINSCSIISRRVSDLLKTLHDFCILPPIYSSLILSFHDSGGLLGGHDWCVWSEACHEWGGVCGLHRVKVSSMGGRVGGQRPARPARYYTLARPLLSLSLSLC